MAGGVRADRPLPRRLLGRWRWWLPALIVVLVVVALTLPGHHGHLAWSTLDMSCHRHGSCVAVGWYEDAGGHYQPMVISESGGTWGRAKRIILPIDASSRPNAYLSRVTCRAGPSCLAGGSYRNRLGGRQEMFVTEEDGAWSRARANTRTRKLSSCAQRTRRPKRASSGGCHR
jgi:hypothetical protein